MNMTPFHTLTDKELEEFLKKCGIEWAYTQPIIPKEYIDKPKPIPTKPIRMLNGDK